MISSEYKTYGWRAKFTNAWSGFCDASRNEKSIQTQLVGGFLVACMAWYFTVSKVEIAILAFAIGLVIICELLNTAIEGLCDLITLDTHPHIKKIKDISAGAVLVASFISVVVGLCVFLPLF